MSDTELLDEIAKLQDLNVSHYPRAGGHVWYTSAIWGLTHYQYTGPGNGTLREALIALVQGVRKVNHAEYHHFIMPLNEIENETVK